MGGKLQGLGLAAVLAVVPFAGALAGSGGLYGGFGIGGSSADIDSAAVDREFASVGLPSRTSADDSDTALKLYGGYQFNRYFAVEGGYVDLGEFNINSQISGGNPGSVKTSLELDGFFVTALGGYPVSEGLFLFAKVGALFWEADADSNATLASGSATASASDDGTDISYGIGAAYRVTEQVQLRIDWDRFDISGDTDTEVDTYSVGIQVNF